MFTVYDYDVDAANLEFQKDILTIGGTAPITLKFEGLTPPVEPGDAGTKVICEITGHLLVRPVEVDACQTQVNAVTIARAKIESVKRLIKHYLSWLSDPTPPDKPDISNSMIETMIHDLRNVDLSCRNSPLRLALKDLQNCRNFANTTTVGVSKS